MRELQIPVLHTLETEPMRSCNSIISMASCSQRNMMRMGGCASKRIATTARNLGILHAPIFPMSSFLLLNSEVDE